ncbi:MAG: DsrE family protein [Candidatus Caldarchaeum sp.]
MNGSKILFIIVSGPAEIEKARQGLRIARNIVREKLAQEVRVLFVGPGAHLLDPSNTHYKLVCDYLTALKEKGVYVAVCSGNLRAYGLDEKVDKQLVIADDSTAVVAEAASTGFIVITF